MKKIITTLGLISAFTLNFASNPHDDLPEFQQQASEVSGAGAQKISNQSTDKPQLYQILFLTKDILLKKIKLLMSSKLPKRQISIFGITPEKIKLFMSCGSFVIYKYAQNSLTDLFILEFDKNGLWVRVRNEVKKADFTHACFNEVTAPVVGEREVSISGTLIEPIFTCSNSFKFAKGTVVADEISITLNFLNPESLISSIMLKFDSENSHKHNKLSLGLIQGSASFLVDQESKLEFRGFEKMTIVLNKNAVEKLIYEGCLWGRLRNCLRSCVNF